MPGLCPPEYNEKWIFLLHFRAPTLRIVSRFSCVSLLNACLALKTETPWQPTVTQVLRVEVFYWPISAARDH